jgi:hypothetical protein
MGGNTANSNVSVLIAWSQEILSHGDDGKVECLSFCNLRSCCLSLKDTMNGEDDHADWCVGYDAC